MHFLITKSYSTSEEKMAKMQSPVRTQTLEIIGVIVAGAAVAVSLFVLFPNMMLEGTSLDPDSSGGEFGGVYSPNSALAPGGSPQASAP